MTASHWYLVQTKPNQESRAEENLLRQGFVCFRPQRQRQPSARSRVASSESLFPGYLFIQLDDVNDNWYPIRSTRGVNRIVAFGSQPTAVSQAIIDAIRERLAAPTGPAPAHQPGAAVRVQYSPALEMDAVFLSPDGDERAIILLRILQREQRVSVALDQLSAPAPVSQRLRA
ncbi:MAG: transcription/translation regulatory transformer protein RfaH [Pseudomonas oryzihabitans]